MLTRIHPLHAVWEGRVRHQVVASPAGIDNDGMRPRKKWQSQQACCYQQTSRSHYFTEADDDADSLGLVALFRLERGKWI